MRRIVSLSVLAIAVAMLGAQGAQAHDFPAPRVTVIVSDEPPGGHPTQQTLIEIPEGPGFDQLTVVAPLGSMIASDADIPDGTIVGRLDAMATTNAIVRPACDLSVEFTVPVRKATTDTDAAAYPPYLRELLPGRHRLRFVSDVSPSADVPVVINTVVDVDGRTGALITHVVVGDPTHPPVKFRACAPQWSKTTLFGVTPDGAPLLTSPLVPATPPRPFTYTFTSRPDVDGHRHEQEVTVVAKVGQVDVAPLAPPAPPPAPAPQEPANLRIHTDAAGETAYLSWDYDPALTSESFATVTYPHPDGGTITEILPVGDGSWAVVPRARAQICGDPPRFSYRVAALTDARVRSEFAELVGGVEPNLSCVTFGSAVRPSLLANTGDGAAAGSRAAGRIGVALLGLGLALASCGVIAQRRRRAM